MKYKVTKDFTKRSENFKPYAVGSTIELTEAEAKTLLEHGYVKKELKSSRKTKEEKATKKTK